MPIPARLLTTTFAVYRPVGAGSPTSTGHPGRLVDDLPRGRPPAAGGLAWTHYLDCQPDVDIRDGTARVANSSTVLYADGDADEVRVPDAAGTSFVVVWVAVRNKGTANESKRVYLTRDVPVWPGP